MRALVISGGGSKGAFAGGVAEYLIRHKKREYDIFVGTSTGSLIIPLLAINKIEKIKKVFTNVSQKDIYNISPFKIKIDKEGNIRTRINHLNNIVMFLRGKKSFGEHKNLRELISRTISRDDFEMIQNSGKKVIAAVSNLSMNTLEYKYASDHGYEDFCDWLWASTSFVPFMSMVEKNGFEYADGGFGDYIPVEEAINVGATEIDVIVLTTRHKKDTYEKTRNTFDVILRSMSFMHDQLSRHDIVIGHMESIYNDNVKVNFIFTPRKLTEYSFYFDAQQMKIWWQEGFDFAKLKYGVINT